MDFLHECLHGWLLKQVHLKMKRKNWAYTHFIRNLNYYNHFTNLKFELTSKEGLAVFIGLAMGTSLFSIPSQDLMDAAVGIVSRVTTV